LARYIAGVMLISKANRKAIFTKLFKEGVMIAEKDFNAPAHPEFPEIPNLQIIKACQVNHSGCKQNSALHCFPTPTFVPMMTQAFGLTARIK
jgi:hypothetical protein